MIAEIDEAAVWASPEACSIALLYCHNPNCGRLHIVFLDEHNKPMMHASAPDDPDFVRELNRAQRYVD